MCIIVICRNPTENISLIWAANRDEFISRSTSPIRQRNIDNVNIIAGRDRVSNGQWMGYNMKTGILAGITNIHEFMPKLYDNSRGAVLKEALFSLENKKLNLPFEPEKCGPFNLIRVNTNISKFQLEFMSNRNLEIKDTIKEFHFINNENKNIQIPNENTIDVIANDILEIPFPHPRTTALKNSFEKFLRNEKIDSDYNIEDIRDVCANMISQKGPHGTEEDRNEFVNMIVENKLNSGCSDRMVKDYANYSIFSDPFEITHDIPEIEKKIQKLGLYGTRSQFIAIKLKDSSKIHIWTRSCIPKFSSWQEFVA